MENSDHGESEGEERRGMLMTLEHGGYGEQTELNRFGQLLAEYLEREGMDVGEFVRRMREVGNDRATEELVIEEMRAREYDPAHPTPIGLLYGFWQVLNLTDRERESLIFEAAWGEIADEKNPEMRTSYYEWLDSEEGRAYMRRIREHLNQ